MSFKPCAKWTQDCQGKQDYDGRLLSISTRLYPPNYSAEGKWSAVTSIHLNHDVPDEYGYGDYHTLAETDIVADTEEEVKLQVEAWVHNQVQTVYRKLVPVPDKL